MTTKKDNFKLRNQKLGTGLEESLGVPRKGFVEFILGAYRGYIEGI